MEKKIFLVIGMAGSGKTTFCESLYHWISEKHLKIDSETGTNEKIFTINLDPAVENTKMPINIDIRDEIDLKEVMNKYNMGSNGAILTSLNLFLISMRKIETNADYLIIDTPGQVEAFVWSGAGFAVVELLKNLGNLEIFFLVDSFESKRHLVYISNMMYAASLKCRYQCAVTVVFNKIDLGEENFYNDHEKFRASLPEEYFSPLLSSMILHFEDFFSKIPILKVSAITNEGKDEFMANFVNN
ncbi:GPN-loop GTPase 1 [Dictyocoela muelleri]|nr:GPN-loop GTPase 1 [Dictyocoela muelleri]